MRYYYPELNFWFKRYWESEGEITIFPPNLPTPLFTAQNTQGLTVPTTFNPLITNATHPSFSDYSVFQVLFCSALDSTAYEMPYTYKMASIPFNILPRKIIDRIKATNSVHEIFVTAEEGIDVFNFEGEKKELIDLLELYRKGETVSIDDIDFDALTTNLARLIYLYLDLKLNLNFAPLNNTALLTDEAEKDILDDLFEYYVVSEAHKLVRVLTTSIDTAETTAKVIRIKRVLEAEDAIFTNNVWELGTIEYPATQEIHGFTLYLNGEIVDASYYTFAFHEYNSTITFNPSVVLQDGDVLILDYTTETDVDNPYVPPVFTGDLFAPVIYSAAFTEEGDPIWSWRTGGGGTGLFRYRIDDGEWVETNDTTYTFIEAGIATAYTLYVEEFGTNGQWSLPGALTVSTAWTTPSPVKPPVITGVSLSPQGYPTWTWTSGGHGVGVYRLNFSPGDPWIEMDTTSSYTLTGIETGSHTIYLQEQGQLGDWSASKTNTIYTNIYDSPNAPIISGDTTTSDVTPTWTWVTGGGGIGLYKYSLNDGPWESSFSTSYTPTTPLFSGTHVFKVREINFDGVWGDIAEFETLINYAYPEGSYMGAIGGLGETDGLMSSIVSVAVTEDEVYVLDNDRCDVQVFNKFGVYLRKFGAVGPEDGQFLRPRCIALQKTGDDILVAVSDFEKSNVQYFNGLTGAFIEEISGDGNVFETPEGLCFYDNELYVIDSSLCKIKVFSGTTLQRQFGTTGTNEGQFSRPYTISVNDEGVYVTDGDREKLLKFTTLGVFVQEWTIGS